MRHDSRGPVYSRSRSSCAVPSGERTLGRGFLTGAIPDRQALDADDWRLENPRFSDEALAENARFVELIEGIAARKGATAAQVALAWVLAQGEDVFTIPGTRRVERLEENLGAWEVVFSDEELADIRSRLPRETAGSRY